MAVSFLPLINTAHVWAIYESMSLYFQKFEFNGSVYYLVRWLGFEYRGHNIIADSGKWMMIATFVAIMGYSLSAKAKGIWPRQMVWVWFFYLLFGTTVHPWYVIPMLAMSVFSTKRFPLIWSAVIFLTYVNYMGGSYIDRIDMVIIEYSVVILAVIIDLFGDRLNRWVWVQVKRHSNGFEVQRIELLYLVSSHFSASPVLGVSRRPMILLLVLAPC